MAGLGVYALAGALAGWGKGIEEAAIAKLESQAREQDRANKLADAKELAQYRFDLSHPNGIVGGGGSGGSSGGGRRKGGGGGGAETIMSNEPVGGAAPSGPVSPADALGYPTYDRGSGATANTSGLPRWAKKGEPVKYVTTAPDGSRRAISRVTSEEVLLSAPTQTPENADSTNTGGLTNLFTGEDGYLYGTDKSGTVRPALDANGNKVRKPDPNAAPDTGTPDLEDSLSGASPEVHAQALAEYSKLRSSGVSREEAAAQVIGRLIKETVTKQPGMIPRLFGAEPTTEQGPATGVSAPTQTGQAAQTQTATKPSMSPETIAASIANARSAISRGADREAVRQKLIAVGITPPPDL